MPDFITFTQTRLMCPDGFRVNQYVKGTTYLEDPLTVSKAINRGWARRATEAEVSGRYVQFPRHGEPSLEKTEVEQLAERTAHSPLAMKHESFINFIEHITSPCTRDILTNPATPAVAEKVGQE